MLVLAIVLVFLFSAIEALLAKVAADRIGTQSLIWELLGYLPLLALYFFIAFRGHGLDLENKVGIWAAFFSGLVCSVGAVAYYYVLARTEATVAIPLLALYPALTVLLAVLILHEQMTLTKLTGVLLSLVSIYLLNKS